MANQHSLRVTGSHGPEGHESAHDAALANVTPFPRAFDAERGSAAASPPRNQAMKVLIAVLVAAVAGTVAWLLLRNPAGPATPAVATTLELAAVDVATVEPQVLSRSLAISGSIAPIVQATVKSKVGGEVEQMTVREGQDVREGDIIARVDTRNLHAQYDRELAAVDKARADLQLATLNRDKNHALLEQHYISQNTYESTESAYAGSVANLKLAEAQARLAQIALEDAVIRAPFAGTIARRHVQPGEKVSPDSAIVSLVDLRQMVLEAAVPAADIPSVAIGQGARFTVGGFGQREFAGEVQRINPITATGSRAITIYIAVANPDRALKGGMFAQGDLTLEATQPVLAIAQRAVHEEGGAHHVYIVRGDKLVRTPVTLGPAQGSSAFVEVRQGLAAGDRIVVADIGNITDGRSVVVADSR